MSFEDVKKAKAYLLWNVRFVNDYVYSFKTLTAKNIAKGIKVSAVHLDKVMMTHNQHEQMTTIVTGKMEIIIDGHKKEMEKGDVVIIPSNTVHSAIIGKKLTVAIDAWSPIRVDYK
jgi:mannose-6-phosphate isomerase-like protein (cupin superfamily)